MLKVMRGSIQIKIGGGFQPIEDFLPTTLPVELEKLEKKDPLIKVTQPQSADKSFNDTRSMSKSASKSATMARLPSKVSNATSMKKRGI